MLVIAAVLASTAFADPDARNPSESRPGASPVPSPGVAGAPGSGYPAALGRIALRGEEPPTVRRRYVRGAVVTSDSSVVQVQRALKNRGYYAGPTDGDAGPGTRAAVRNFRREHGLGSSTRIDGDLIRALRL